MNWPKMSGHPPFGIQQMVLRERVIKPVLAGLGKPRVGRPPNHIDPADQHYIDLQREMRCLFGDFWNSQHEPMAFEQHVVA